MSTNTKSTRSRTKAPSNRSRKASKRASAASTHVSSVVDAASQTDASSFEWTESWTQTDLFIHTSRQQSRKFEYTPELSPLNPDGSLGPRSPSRTDIERLAHHRSPYSSAIDAFLASRLDRANTMEALEAEVQRKDAEIQQLRAILHKITHRARESAASVR